MKRNKNSLKSLGIILVLAAITYFGTSEYFKRAEDVSDFGGMEESEVEMNIKSDLQGVVTHVSDGDTMVLKDSLGKTHKVRIDGIDAPEMGQDFGKQSKSFLEKLILNKRVSVEVVGIDQYRRILGVVSVNGTDVNKAMLRNGMAWQYKYNKNKEYALLVKQAKEQNKNIWSNPNAIDPHQWRKENK